MGRYRVYVMECSLRHALAILCVNVLFIGWVDSLDFLLIYVLLVVNLLVLVQFYVSFFVYFVFDFGN